MDGAEDVGGMADVFDRQFVVDLVARLVLRGQIAELTVVVLAAADRLLEDGRVGREAAQVVLIDHLFQFAARDELALHLVEPNALPDLPELHQRVAHETPPRAGDRGLSSSFPGAKAYAKRQTRWCPRSRESD